MLYNTRIKYMYKCISKISEKKIQKIGCITAFMGEAFMCRYKN